MGNCCGYLRITTSVAVSDPLILAKCDQELKSQINSNPPKTQIDPSAEINKLNFNNNYCSSQENIASSNKEDTNLKEDAIIIKKVEEIPKPMEINIMAALVKLTEESSPSRKSVNLKPLGGLEPHRRDSRSTTSINNLKKDKKSEAEAEKKIEVNELKLSAKLVEKIQKLKNYGQRSKNREYTKIFLRSMTMGGDGLAELAELEEKEDEKEEDDKTKEEITKELKENKETIERNHKKLTFIQQQEEIKVHKNGEVCVKKKKVNVQRKRAAEEPVPGKSLLKKYRTIGDDKKKKKGKKVKFQDLVDKKKKKKAAQNKF
jgi:hypothetical protein